MQITRQKDIWTKGVCEFICKKDFSKQATSKWLEVLIEVTHSFQKERNPGSPANGEIQKTKHITKQFSLILFSETNTNHNFLSTLLCHKKSCLAKPCKHGVVQVREDQVTHMYNDVQRLPAGWMAVEDCLCVVYMYISVNTSSRSKQ